MLNIPIMDNLLVELSDAQQEMIIGGGALSNIEEEISSYYNYERSITSSYVEQSTGPYGSVNIRKFDQDYQKIDTGSYQGIKYLFG